MCPEGCVANFAQEVVKGQLTLLVALLCSQRIELFSRCEAFFPGFPLHLSLLEHVHQFIADRGCWAVSNDLNPSMGRVTRFTAAMILLNGMITNDKFCLIRHCQVQLRWSRQPYRFPPSQT